MFYSYQRHINGFAAILEEEEAANIAKHPGVVSVFPNTLLKLHTSHSWDFLGLEKIGVSHNSSLWQQSNFGEDIIIGHIDSGIWPESESFSDTGYGPVPSKWKGICANDTKSGVPCNRKIIGARYFINGYNAPWESTVVPGYMQTPRDYDGHGTHTLSTSSGNFVDASIAGVPVGTIKGGSPKARVAVYKVCWDKKGGCASADILQAFDYAIDDGVDVISISIGGLSFTYFGDSIAIGSFHAMMKNVVVSASAGNSGKSYSVNNAAPWIITVGASTMDRSFTSAVILDNGLKLQGGGSISKPITYGGLYYLMIYAGDAKAAESSFLDASQCVPGSLDKKKVKGQILVCLRGDGGDYRGIAARDAGAVGMILCNKESDGDSIPSHVDYLPSVQISYKNSVLLFTYLNTTDIPYGFISDTRTKFGLKPSPAMAFFSSGGPSILSPEILKPDITAPGHGIIASFSPAATQEGYEADDFAMLSGTSMSCPHVTGVIGLLKKLHPDWSPAAIRSALMTTARTRDNTGKPMMKAYPQYTNKTTPYFYGAGHIQPNHAAYPGLVYDLTVDDHLNFLCAIGYTQEQIQLISGGLYVCPKDTFVRDLNYPSISIGGVAAAAASNGVTVLRTLKNVDVAPATYSVTIRSPPGVLITVDPKILSFEKVGDERSFKLTMKVKRNLTSNVFGDLVWADGLRHRVRSPIVAVAYL